MPGIIPTITVTTTLFHIMNLSIELSGVNGLIKVTGGDLKGNFKATG